MVPINALGVLGEKRAFMRVFVCAPASFIWGKWGCLKKQDLRREEVLVSDFFGGKGVNMMICAMLIVFPVTT